VQDVPAEVHLHVDVHGAPRVPTRVDRLEQCEPGAIGPLDAAHEGLALGALLREAGVRARGVAVPDIDGRATDRLAVGDIDDRRPELEGNAGPPLADVAPDLVALEVVRAFRLLRREDAADEAGGDRRGPGAGS
jgi:hypothetical protein